jgi:hypothetical protein
VNKKGVAISNFKRSKLTQNFLQRQINLKITLRNKKKNLDYLHQSVNLKLHHY